MKICIFCSAAEVNEKYIEAAREFAELIAKNGHTLVWGGSNVGLMKVVADTVQENGGKITGISVEHFRTTARPNADEMIFAKDLAERKALFLQHSDMLVAMVGGTGTLDEMMEMIELKKYGVHNKPLAFLSTDGYYDGIRAFFDRADKEGFLHYPVADVVHFSDKPQELITYINSHK